MSTTTNIKYPPAAHTHHDESAAEPAVTSSQPCASATMTVGSNNDQARVGKAERIRGGCVPCPVCVGSFVYVTHLTDWPFRTEAFVGSSRYPAAVAEKTPLYQYVAINKLLDGLL